MRFLVDENLPPSLARLLAGAARAEAVALFADRARNADAHFALDDLASGLPVLKDVSGLPSASVVSASKSAVGAFSSNADHNA